MKWQLTYKTEIAKMSESDKKELKRALFCEELHESLKELGEPNAEAQAMYLALKVFEMEETLGHPLMLQEISSALDGILKFGDSVDELLTMPMAEFKQAILTVAFQSFAAAEEGANSEAFTSHGYTKQEELAPGTLKFVTEADLKAMGEKVAAAANHAELGDGTKTRDWQLGYAAALKDMGESFSSEAVYRHIRKEYRKQDAKRHLLGHFGLDEDPDDEEALARFREEVGVYLPEAITEGSIGYCLDDLAKMYEDAEDCNVPENDTWENVINQFLEDGACRLG